MKTKLYTLLVAMMIAGSSAKAQTPDNTIKAIKVEFDGTSMTIGLSQQPKIVMEDGYVVIKTILQSIALPLPCRATFVDASGAAIEDVVVYNNDKTKPLSVYSLDGKKLASLRDKDELVTLRKGIYIINGKKMAIQ